jgi:hypothetical protein
MEIPSNSFSIKVLGPLTLLDTNTFNICLCSSVWKYYGTTKRGLSTGLPSSNGSILNTLSLIRGERSYPLTGDLNPYPMTFSDLEFHYHAEYEGATEAFKFFPNGYGVWVTGGHPFAGDGKETFEIHILEGVEDEYTVLFFNDLCDFSLPYLTRDKVQETLNYIQTLELYEANRGSNQESETGHPTT